MEEAINSHVYVYLTLFGKQIPFITDAVVVTWVIMAFLMIAVLVMTRNLQTVPAKGQKVAEAAVTFVNNMCKNQIGHHWRTFAPYLGTIILYLALSNICAVFNVIPSGDSLAAMTGLPAWEHFEFALHPPTKNFNVTLCLAIMSIVVCLYAEFRFRGVKGFVRSFYKPTPMSGFVKVLDFFTRPLSLCLRLFGNIMGGTIVMTLLYTAMPWILPAFAAVYFDLFDGLLQAYVFVFLTMIYISEAVEEE